MNIFAYYLKGPGFKRLGDLHSVTQTLLASDALTGRVSLGKTGTTSRDFIAEDT